MAVLLNLLYCELLKLRHSKMISISVLGAVAVPFMLLVEELQTHAEHPEEKILLDQVYANSVLYMLLLANMMVSVAIASYLFSREYAENTWKTILPIPISRTKVLAGKFLTLFIWDLGLTLVSWFSILFFSGIFHAIFGMSEYSLFTAFRWIPKYFLLTIFMFATTTPFVYIAQKTKGFVAPMITSAVIVLGSAALCNQEWGALYPWTASVLLLQGRVEGTGYPVWLSITILIFVSGIGFMLTFLHFKKEDLK